jgi:NitT/TauT family transport system substrate-binding protein
MRPALPRPSRAVRAAALLATAALALTACGGGDADGVAAAGEDGLTGSLTLGYFPNLTHAPAIVGLADGTFAEALGDGVELETTTFNAGPDAMQALASGATDAQFVGPGPATNAFLQSSGEALVVVAGVTSGGASLVVRPGVSDAADSLRGLTLSSPQLANTQDIALRFWLQEKGLRTDQQGGGDVQIQPQDNAQIVSTFEQGAIDGAWVPEPTASRLVAAGGEVLVDERDLWPDGQFPTTVLAVNRAYAEANPAVVQALVDGLVATDEAIEADPAAAQQTVSDAIGELSGRPLDPELVEAAWPQLSFTTQTPEEGLQAGAEHALAVGLLDGDIDLTGLVDDSYLEAAGATTGSR